MAWQCSLGDMKDALPVHVVVKGLWNEKLKTELLQIEILNEDKLVATFAKCELMERTMEMGRAC